MFRLLNYHISNENDHTSFVKGFPSTSKIVLTNIHNVMKEAGAQSLNIMDKQQRK